ncbi:hypothetical protein [Rhodococcus opacus]|uniref:hypothetical protein n=1 Tax=Rhodococcus opacus TaxID=37919 RepID=UPI0012FD0D57|nr:hypothetical protein [Rhodococcus opacus]
MTIERGAMKFLMKLTHAAPNPLGESASLQMISYEDSIHPVDLRFDPPLIEHGLNASAFRYQWEKLTYMFDLPDPASFPKLEIDEADEPILSRFVEVCRRLAGYSAINDSSRLMFESKGESDWTVTAEHPSDEAFAGTSVFFRQLHNSGDEASYDKVKGILFKSARRLPPDQFSRFKAQMTFWDDARKALMNKMLATLVCEKAASPNAPADFPFSYKGVNPAELIVTYNYGDSLHWGTHKERFVELTADPTNAVFYKYSCLIAMVVLSHFYFGVAEIIESVQATNSATDA